MLQFFFQTTYFLNLLKKNFLIDFIFKTKAFNFTFYFLNLTTIFFGEKYIIEYQTKLIFFYFLIFNIKKTYSYLTLNNSYISFFILALFAYFNIFFFLIFL